MEGEEAIETKITLFGSSSLKLAKHYYLLTEQCAFKCTRFSLALRNDQSVKN